MPNGRAATGLLCLLALVCGHAQSPPAVAEIETHSAPLTFSSTVNLVSVPVVVRDSSGHAVGNIERQDFQLFDNGKAQIVSRFTVEKFGAAPAEPATPPAATPSAPQAAAAPAQAMPDRFVVYLFDDVNTTFTDLAQARDAAFRNIAKSLRPSERAAVYTTSGQTMLDFTADRDRLRQTLLAMRPQNPVTSSNLDCPPMSIYQADQIMENNDPWALGAAMADVKACTGGDLANDEQEFRARNAALRTQTLAGRNVGAVFATIDGVIAKLSRMAGQRTMVLVSSGFVIPDDRRQEEVAALERAVRAGIVVNSLDARALYALNPGEDSSAHSADNPVAVIPNGAPYSGYIAAGGSSLQIKMQEAQQSALVDRDLMAEVASATGGTFLENTNDLDGGFARLADAPEFIYILGFNPENLKSDGRFHTLKVTIHDSKGLAIETRRGYYAPQFAQNSAARAKEEIEEAFFSRDEIHDIPVLMQTQFLKTTDYNATVSIGAKVDLRQIQFRKEGDRNRNDLTVVSGLFDTDGNFVCGTQKTVELRLLDTTVASHLDQGLTVKTTFDVAPGKYVVRLVVRDSEGSMMSAENGAIEIP